jgi:hypothetical protein
VGGDVSGINMVASGSVSTRGNPGNWPWNVVNAGRGLIGMASGRANA